MRAIALLVLRRSVYGVVTLFVISVLIFTSTQVMPGDTARLILGLEAPPEQIAALRAELKLDRPATEQYAHWIGGLVRGDLGTSFVSQLPVGEVFKERIRNTGVLMLIVLLIGVPLALAIGTVSAWRRDSAFDHGAGVATLLFVAVPEFVIAVAVVALLSTNVFTLFPAVAILPPGTAPWERPMQLVLPALTLIGVCIPHIARVMRASMIDVLESDYIEMARLKGMPERRVLLRHAVRNGVAPSIQVTAATAASLAGGLVVVEYIFNYPGVGAAFVDAVTRRDIPVVQLFALVIAGIYLVLNLLADIGTILVSPRLRTSLK